MSAISRLFRKAPKPTPEPTEDGEQAKRAEVDAAETATPQSEAPGVGTQQSAHEEHVEQLKLDLTKGQASTMIVGRALYEAARMLGPVNPLEMAGGIRHMMKHPGGEDPASGNLTETEREFLADGLKEAEPGSAAFARELETWARYAFAAYGGSEDRFAERAQVSKDDLILYNTRATACRPAFAVVVDSERDAIVLAIRGTDTFADVLTDLAGAPVPYLVENGYAHRGMTLAAGVLVGLSHKEALYGAEDEAHASPSSEETGARQGEEEAEDGDEAGKDKEEEPSRVGEGAKASAETARAAEQAAVDVSKAEHSMEAAGTEGEKEGRSSRGEGGIVPLIRNLMHLHPSFRVVVAGHSLGAGVAALLTLRLSRLLRFDPAAEHRCGAGNDFPFQTGPLHCYGYGVPPVVTEALARAHRGLITSVVNAHDLIPRLSMRSVDYLANHVKDTKDIWWDALVAEYRRTRLGKATGAARSAVVSTVSYARDASSYALSTLASHWHGTREGENAEAEADVAKSDAGSREGRAPVAVEDAPESPSPSQPADRDRADAEGSGIYSMFMADMMASDVAQLSSGKEASEVGSVLERGMQRLGSVMEDEDEDDKEANVRADSESKVADEAVESTAASSAGAGDGDAGAAPSSSSSEDTWVRLAAQWEERWLPSWMQGTGDNSGNEATPSNAADKPGEGGAGGDAAAASPSEPEPRWRARMRGVRGTVAAAAANVRYRGTKKDAAPKDDEVRPATDAGVETKKGRDFGPRLLVPGMVLHIRQEGRPRTMEEASEQDAEQPREVQLRPVDAAQLGIMFVSPYMASDHKMTNYIEGIAAVQGTSGTILE